MSGVSTTSGYGVYGYSATSDSGHFYNVSDSAYAVYAENAEYGGVSMYGNASGASGIGVKGSGYQYGVYGTSSSGDGVHGDASGSGSNAVAAAATSGAYGVYATSDTGIGVLATSGTGDAGDFYTSGGGNGVSGWSSTGYGVYGTSTYTTAVTGIVANSDSGVAGVNTGTGYGVSGWSSTGYGVYGTSAYTTAVAGIVANSDSGVAGVNTGTGYGVSGWSASGPAVYGSCTGSGCMALYANGDLQVTGTPYCSGCTAFTTNSDIRLKKNVEPLEGALVRLLQLRGVTFEWRAPEEHGNHSGTQRGFVAQEVEKVMPEWVGVDGNGFKTLNLTGMEPMVVESIRELKIENDDLRAKLETSQSRMARLEARLDALESGRAPIAGSVVQGASRAKSVGAPASKLR